MVLPQHIGDRSFQKFVENAAGDVAERVAGGVHLENLLGQKIEFLAQNGKYDLGTHDSESHKTLLRCEQALFEIRDLLKKILE